MAGRTPIERAGGRYYPKLQCAVPFTPVTGRRSAGGLLAPTARQRERSVARQRDAGRRAGSACPRCHITFLDARRMAACGELGFLQRTTSNSTGRTRAIAPSTISSTRSPPASARRSAGSGARRRRRRNRDRMGDRRDLTEAHWDAFFDFYMDTGSRKWGSPYLTATFFSPARRAHGGARLCWSSRKRRGATRRRAQLHRPRHALWPLLGRHRATTPSCISRSATTRPSTSRFGASSPASRPARKASTSSPAAICPTTTYRAHYIAEPGLRRAVADYLKRERRAVAREATLLTEEAPFKRA